MVEENRNAGPLTRSRAKSHPEILLLTSVKTRSGAGCEVERRAPSPISQDDGSDDDAPLEVSSKKINTEADIVLTRNEPEEKSLFEQIQEQKKEEEEGKKRKSHAKRLKKKKIGEGTFEVKLKKSEFKVVSLDKGVKAPLESVRNYKAELLAVRTADHRVKGSSKQVAHRAKWVGRM